MNKKIATLLVALMASLPVSFASASETLKIGYINMERVFRDAPISIKSSKRIQEEFTKRDLDLQRMGKQMQALQDLLEKNAVTMAETERRSKEKELNELSREFQRKQREFREDLNLRQNEERGSIIEKATKAMKQIAETEKYDLILQDAAWAGPKADLTERIIKALSEGK